MSKIKSRTFKTRSYSSVHFRHYRKQKITIIIKLKNQNATLHAVCAYNKFQVKLPGVTEWLVSNIATRILFRTHKFWTSSTPLPPLRIFVFQNPWHNFAEPSLRNTLMCLSSDFAKQISLYEVSCSIVACRFYNRNSSSWPVIFGAQMVVIMKISLFWDMTPWSSYICKCILN